MPDEVAKLTAVFEADSSDLEDGITRVDNGLSGLSGRLGSAIGNVGDTFTGIGRSMLAFSAPAIAGFGLVTTAALGFGTEMTNIQAVTGDSNEQIAALGDTILDTDSKFSNVELASTFYDIAGGVTDVNARMDVFNAAIATAQAGNADLKATTQALISVVNSYGANVLEAADASDVLTRTVGMGVGTMNDFANAFPDVAGLAASLNIPFEDLGASLAYMTTQGFSATESATILKNMMSSLLNPTADLAGVISDLGYESGQAMINALGVAGSYQAILDSQDTLSGVITNQEALTGAIAVTKDTADDLQLTMGNFKVNLPTSDIQDFTATFRAGVEDATAMAEAIQMEDAAAQIALLKNEADDLAVIMGGALAPSLVDVAQEVKPLVRQFSTFAQQNPQLIRQVAMITLGIAGLGAGFVALGTVLSGAVTVLSATGIALAFLVSPLGLALAGVLALGAAFYWLYDNNVLGFRDAIVQASDAMRGFARDASDTAASIAGFISLLDVNTFASAAIATASAFWNGFKNTVLGMIPGSITEIKNSIVTTASGIFSGGNGIDFGSFFDFSTIDLASIGGIITVLSRLRTIAGLAGTAISLIGPALSLMMTPLGIATLGIVGIGAALYIAYSQNIFGFKDAIDKQLVPALQRGGTEALKFVANIVAAFTTGGLSNAAQSIVTGLTNGANQATVAAKGYGPAIATGLSGGMSAAGPQISAGLGVIGQKVDEQSPIVAEKGGVMSGQLTGQFITGLITYAPSILLGLVAFSAIVMKYLTIDLPTAVLGWMADVTVAFGKGFIAGIIMEGPSIIAAFGGLGNDILAAVSSGLNSIIAKAEEVLAKLGLVKQAQADVSSSSGTVTTDNSGNTTITVTTHPQGRASGGSVSGGTPYIVGEVGPELFVPKTSGTIVPNNQLSIGGGGVTINGGTFILQGIQNVQQLYDELARLNKQRGSNAAFAKAG